VVPTSPLTSARARKKLSHPTFVSQIGTAWKRHLAFSPVSFPFPATTALHCESGPASFKTMDTLAAPQPIKLKLKVPGAPSPTEQPSGTLPLPAVAPLSLPLPLPGDAVEQPKKKRTYTRKKDPEKPGPGKNWRKGIKGEGFLNRRV
jgi:hypothetical protein